MKAVVFRGVGDIRLDDVPVATVREPNDAIVRLTASAICGTDLHFGRGTMTGTKPGCILGHEGVGVIEDVGPNVRNLVEGDRGWDRHRHDPSVGPRDALACSDR